MDPTDGFEATSEKILRNLLTLGLVPADRPFQSTLPLTPRLTEQERVKDAGAAGAAAALDEGASAALLARLNGGGGGATFNSIDDGLQHALSDKPVTPGADDAAKARFQAYVESLTPSEFLFQFNRRGLGFNVPGFEPDLTNFQNVAFILDFQRRVDAQQITRDGRLVQPIGPITTLPVTPPTTVSPIGPGIGVPLVPTPGTGDGRGRPGTPTPALPTIPGIGVPIVPVPPQGGVVGRPVRPIGPGLGDIIIVGGGVAPGTARPVDKGGNGQVPPGQVRPPTTGSGGTGQQPGFQQGFPDNLFARNPPDP